MNKCLSCGHLRHDLELNCPECGSFYSAIVNDFLINAQASENALNKLLAKIKLNDIHVKKPFIISGVVIFLVLIMGVIIL